MPDIYPDQQALNARGALLSNPATIAISGPAYGTEHYTYGAMVAGLLRSAPRAFNACWSG